MHFFSQETFKRVKTVHVGVAIFSEMKRTILQRPFLLLVASVDGWVTAIDEAFTKIWTVSLKGPIFTSLTMTSDESYLLVIEQNKSISAIDIIDPIHGVKSFRTPKSELI